MTKILAALLGGALLTIAPAFAQTAAPAAPAAAQGVSEADIQALRQDIRSQRKQLTAETLKLTDAEATRFWPVYDRYMADVTKINDGRYKLIEEYSAKFGSFTDAQAQDYITRWLNVDVQLASLRGSYVPEISKVLPGIKAASFFQIDRRLGLLLELQLASNLPLLQFQAQAAPAK